MKKKKRAGLPIKKILLIVSIVSGILNLLTIAGTLIWLNVTVDREADARLFSAASGSHTTRFYYNEDRGGEIYHPREWEGERLSGGVASLWCSVDTLPDHVKNAFLAAEDHRFYEHHGVDWLRTGKAILNYVLRFDERFGGSTVTQQLIKNISGEDEATPLRKVREAYRAIQLDKRFSKDRILELYLNIVPMGENCAGIAAGASLYFDKKPEELTVAEAAALAATIKAPAYYNPKTHPEENRERRLTVIHMMAEYGMIDPETEAAASSETLSVTGHFQKGVEGVHSWYVETVIDEVKQDLIAKGYTESAASYLLYHGGLEIYTAADPSVQGKLETIFSSFDGEAGIEYAATVIDPQSGDLLGIVGGVGSKSGDRLLNHALTLRAPGSALKPLSVYAPALDRGLITWASVLDDVPVTFEGGSRPWPRNSPNVYDGLCDVATALSHSKNTVSVRVLHLLGKEASYATLTGPLGLTSIIRREETEGGRLTDLEDAPLALGQLTHGVTLLDLTAAYTSLASGDGERRAKRSYLAVYDGMGNLLLKKEIERSEAFAPTTASIMTKMLEKAVLEGSGRGVTLPGGIPVAGKTGTSSSGKDKWFLGYSPYYLAGVWCGSPDGKNTVSEGENIRLYDRLMKALHREIADSGNVVTSFSLAPGVYRARYCRDGGALPATACLLDPRGGRISEGYFTASTLPVTPCACHTLVPYVEGEGILAEPNPLASGFRQVGMIMPPERSFPVQVYVKDAQYVYRPLGGVAPTYDPLQPFFLALLPKGRYPGVTRTADGRQFNSAARETRPYLFFYE